MFWSLRSMLSLWLIENMLWMMVWWEKQTQKNLSVSRLGHGLMTLYRVYFGLCWLADMEVLQTHHSDLLGLCRQSALHRATLRQHKGNDISPTTLFTHRYLIIPPSYRLTPFTHWLHSVWGAQPLCVMVVYKNTLEHVSMLITLTILFQLE